MNDEAENADIKQLMLAAIDEAFQQQLGKLFQVWFVDPTGQPDRAAAGAARLIATYRQSIAMIEKASSEEER
jgi:hypothetical protein